MSSTPRTPSGLKTAGRRLWREITSALDLDEHERALLIEAARTVDALAALAAIVDREGVMPAGKAHPALVESRQQRIALARLIASLRLPEDLQQPERRPQRRGAARGSYLRAL